MAIVLKTISDSKAAQQDLAKLNEAVNKIQKNTESMAQKFTSFGKTIAAGLIGSVALAGFTKYSDKITALEGRLKVATKSNESFVFSMKQVQRIAISSRSDLESVSKLYQRVALATRDMGIQQQKVAKFTELVTKAVKSSGGDAITGGFAIQQLGQALGSNRLSGDELRSILENSAGLALAIADGLGVSIGKLRELGEQGKLTTDKVFGAIIKQEKIINENFAKFGVTYSDAFTNVGNAFQILFLKVSKLFSQTGFSLASIINNFAEKVFDFADNFELKIAIIYSDIVLFVTKIANLFSNLQRHLESIGAAIIASFVGVFTYLINNTENISNKLSRLFNKLSTNIKGFFNNLLGNVFKKENFNKLSTAFSELLKQLKTKIIGFYNNFISLFPEIKLDNILESFKNIPKFLKDVLNKSKDIFKSIIGNIQTSFSNINLNNLYTNVVITLNKIKDIVFKTFEKIKNYLPTISIENIFKGFKEALSTVKKWVRQVYNYLYWLYDEAVGNSIIPDLIIGIRDWCRKLLGEPLNAFKTFSKVAIQNLDKIGLLLLFTKLINMGNTIAKAFFPIIGIISGLAIAAVAALSAFALVDKFVLKLPGQNILVELAKELPKEAQLPIIGVFSTIFALAIVAAFQGTARRVILSVFTTAALLFAAIVSGADAVNKAFTDIAYGFIDILYAGFKGLFGDNILRSFQTVGEFLSVLAKSILIFESGRALWASVIKTGFNAPVGIGNQIGRLGTTRLLDSRIEGLNKTLARLPNQLGRLVTRRTTEFTNASSELARQRVNGMPIGQAAATAAINRGIGGVFGSREANILLNRAIAANTSLAQAINDQNNFGNRNFNLKPQAEQDLLTQRGELARERKRIGDVFSNALNETRDMIRNAISEVGGLIGFIGGTQLGFSIVEGMENASSLQKIGVIIATAMGGRLIGSVAALFAETFTTYLLATLANRLKALAIFAFGSVFAGLTVYLGTTGAIVISAVAALIGAYYLWRQLPEDWRSSISDTMSEIDWRKIFRFDPKEEVGFLNYIQFILETTVNNVLDTFSTILTFIFEIPGNIQDLYYIIKDFSIKAISDFKSYILGLLSNDSVYQSLIANTTNLFEAIAIGWEKDINRMTDLFEQAAIEWEKAVSITTDLFEKISNTWQDVKEGASTVGNAFNSLLNPLERFKSKISDFFSFSIFRDPDKKQNIGFSSGGYVAGSGGSKDDKINARLSNGEFVINASATQKYRPLLEFINKGGDLVKKGFSLASFPIYNMIKNSNDLLLKNATGIYKGTDDKVAKQYWDNTPIIHEFIDFALPRVPDKLIEQLPGFIQLYAKASKASITGKDLSKVKFSNTLYNSADIDYLKNVIKYHEKLLAEGATTYPNFGGKVRKGNIPYAAFKSYEKSINPKFKDIKNNLSALKSSLGRTIFTLGAFNYNRDKDGNVLVKGDAVDFNVAEHDKTTYPTNLAKEIAYSLNIFGIGRSTPLGEALWAEIARYVGRRLDQRADSKATIDLNLGKFANGGYISGPGGPRDDLIPAMLSNGEFVINAKAASQNRGLLEAINNGTIKGFQLGGAQDGSTAAPIGIFPNVTEQSIFNDVLGKLKEFFDKLFGFIESKLPKDFGKNLGEAFGLGGQKSGEKSLAVDILKKTGERSQILTEFAAKLNQEGFKVDSKSLENLTDANLVTIAEAIDNMQENKQNFNTIFGSANKKAYDILAGQVAKQLKSANVQFDTAGPIPQIRELEMSFGEQFDLFASFVPKFEGLEDIFNSLPDQLRTEIMSPLVNYKLDLEEILKEPLSFNADGSLNVLRVQERLIKSMTDKDKLAQKTLELLKPLLPGYELLAAQLNGLNIENFNRGAFLSLSPENKTTLENLPTEVKAQQKILTSTDPTITNEAKLAAEKYIKELLTNAQVIVSEAFLKSLSGSDKFKETLNQIGLNVSEDLYLNLTDFERGNVTKQVDDLIRLYTQAREGSDGVRQAFLEQFLKNRKALQDFLNRKDPESLSIGLQLGENLFGSVKDGLNQAVFKSITEFADVKETFENFMLDVARDVIRIVVNGFTESFLGEGSPLHTALSSLGEKIFSGTKGIFSSIGSSLGLPSLFGSEKDTSTGEKIQQTGDAQVEATQNSTSWLGSMWSKISESSTSQIVGGLTAISGILIAGFAVGGKGKVDKLGLLLGLVGVVAGGFASGAFSLPGSSGTPSVPPRNPSPGRAKGGILEFANGGVSLFPNGQLFGPGTGTSDSIAAWLSNGEFVVNAKSTKQFLPLLEAINSNRYANGGMVSNGLVNNSSMINSSFNTPSNRNKKENSLNQVFNINVTGDISRQTRSEIEKMLPNIASGVNSYNRDKGLSR